MLSAVFERFTVAARQVIVGAQGAARELEHDYIGTEHILLGLVWDPAQLPAQLLAPLGVDRASVRAKVLEHTGQGKHPTSGQIPFTPRAKKTLELALRETLRLGHSDIDSGHLLLGLLSEREGLGARILLVDFNVSAAELGKLVAQRLGNEQRPSGIVQALQQTSEFGFVARPDTDLRRLLMRAAALALADGREQITLADVRAALCELPDE